MVSRPQPPAVPVSTGATNPAAAYAIVRQREDTIRTLRAQFAAVVHQGTVERRADGVLLVKKPDRFRMRLVSLFGVTVFDYTRWGTHARMELPLQGTRLMDDEISTGAPFSPGDLRPAFLRAVDAFPGECTPRAAEGATLVECRDADGTLLRTISIEPPAQTIGEEVSYTGNQPHLTIRYSDYRAVGSTVLPFAIALTDAQRDVQIAITLRSYEVNPALDDALFAPAAEARR